MARNSQQVVLTQVLVEISVRDALLLQKKGIFYILNRRYSGL